MNEAAFRDLISGRKRGAIAGLGRLGLGGLSCFYSAAVRVRNRLYDLRVQRSHSASVPVVSVGNVTTGGTGKTPFVAWLANFYHEKGLRVTLLSRGYRALQGAVNDEKLVLDLLCPGIPHVQNADRVAGAQTAVREHSAQLIVLDDGFQHRRLKRDLDIVLIDALCPWGYGSLLPRGLLREPETGLRRASVIVLTRADQCDAETKRQILDQIDHHSGKTAVVEVAYPAMQLRNARGETNAFAAIASQPVFAFCGIGNPDGFRRTLHDAGIHIADSAFHPFPDHFHYRAEDLRTVAEQARQSGCTAIVTTQKDLVKISQTQLNGLPLWAVEIGTKVLANLEHLETKLNAVLSAIDHPV